MELDDALELLRDAQLGVINLTGSNVQQLKDKRAKKVLEPVLQKVLPRRRKGIEHSSYYRALRAKLLPYNPYFKQDVVNLRGFFRIPDGQIADIDLTPFPDRKEPWDKEDVLNWRQAMGCWLQIHGCIARKAQLDVGLPPLPQWLMDSAGSMLKFGENAPIGWLGKEPNVPAPYYKRFDLRIPMDRCVARLIERYRLPWQCHGNLQYFILTQKEKYIEHISPFDVIMEPIEAPIGQAYRVTIDWIDEYTTKQQWDEVYENSIHPRQISFWEKRGELQHSRQIDLDRLTKPWIRELYKLMAEHQIAGRRFSADKAFELMSQEEKLPPYIEGIERSQVYSRVKTLDVLCKPRD